VDGPNHPNGSTTAVPGGEKSNSDQLQEMKQLLQVKDQMVWTMLEERKGLQGRLEAQAAKIKELEAAMRDKDSALKNLEESTVKEHDEWKTLCEELQGQASSLKKENQQLKGEAASNQTPAAEAVKTTVI